MQGTFVNHKLFDLIIHYSNFSFIFSMKELKATFIFHITSWFKEVYL